MENIRRHFGILLCLLFGCFLLLSEKTIMYQTLIGIVAIIWAILLMRVAKGEEGEMKPFKETKTYKDLKK
jgi:hypothetical protein